MGRRGEGEEDGEVGRGGRRGGEGGGRRRERRKKCGEIRP